ncbi:hypothetical protein [Pseudomonas haemolytica]|uniref:Uncharacterized protein n=1 Tax=Pseudomonas haemolytica TaxID=2600065 RepID=A0A5P1DHQ8_9PSED|nr:hypothetical protein [Pseudomonas haemolytica]MBJ2247788.1 hypothetical protein [Pseudomonas haemolytica]MBJ2275468.1 hypothetical protein [Pseudomonas haemolytica]MBK3450493.1 hypothetical protein [Pseudomonas haemolytica]MBK3462205.1 hypothetical protein [Pseudomonas haemolytica]MRJ40001.1 hypothetical protein [Pseudomonas haemolytica]
MDSARCTVNNTDYTGVGFAALPEAERADYRRHLVCVMCGTKAYFRKEASSGQGPCFGARPHANCVLATVESARGMGGNNEENALHNPGTRIVLDEAQGAAEIVNGDPGEPGGAGAGGRRFTGDGGRPNAVSRKRLGPLLKTLIYEPAFRTSTVYVEIPGRDTRPARDLFVNFSDVSQCQPHTLYGFWGVIYDTGYGNDGTLWVNTGEWEDVSVAIDPTDVAPFLTRHKTTVANLDGAHILVFGTTFKAGSGKQIIKPSSVQLTALNED